MEYMDNMERIFNPDEEAIRLRSMYSSAASGGSSMDWEQARRQIVSSRIMYNSASQDRLKAWYPREAKILEDIQKRLLEIEEGYGKGALLGVLWMAHNPQLIKKRPSWPRLKHGGGDS
ncbi:MAG: hypothetical protein SVY53_11215 [Chloroflexota bacterium]|nr:hypothetical protein [Chloroflexota bacterium]